MSSTILRATRPHPVAGLPSSVVDTPREKLRSWNYTDTFRGLELIGDLDDKAKRDFYASECSRGNRSVRELKWQIASL